MTEPTDETLVRRLNQWGQDEIRHQVVRWTPEFLRLKARITRWEHRSRRIDRLERAAWTAAAMAGILGLCLTWPPHGWASTTEAPFLAFPPLCSLLFLGRSLWILIEP